MGAVAEPVDSVVADSSGDGVSFKEALESYLNTSRKERGEEANEYESVVFIRPIERPGLDKFIQYGLRELASKSGVNAELLEADERPLVPVHALQDVRHVRPWRAPGCLFIESSPPVDMLEMLKDKMAQLLEQSSQPSMHYCSPEELNRHRAFQRSVPVGMSHSFICIDDPQEWPPAPFDPSIKQPNRKARRRADKQGRHHG